MRQAYVKILIGIVLLFLFASICLLVGTLKSGIEEDLKTKELAKTLQVDLASHKEYTGNFPSHYFYLTLKPGMTLAEVHQQVIGYQKWS